VEGQGEGQCGVVSSVRGAGWARGAEKSGAGQLELGKMAGEGGGVGRREKQREEGLHCKAKTTMPNGKSVELSKIYNFALRFSFKRVKDLNLI
jgi:hypothetical protein